MTISVSLNTIDSKFCQGEQKNLYHKWRRGKEKSNKLVVYLKVEEETKT